MKRCASISASADPSAVPSRRRLPAFVSSAWRAYYRAVIGGIIKTGGIRTLRRICSPICSEPAWICYCRGSSWASHLSEPLPKSATHRFENTCATAHDLNAGRPSDMDRPRCAASACARRETATGRNQRVRTADLADHRSFSPAALSSARALREPAAPTLWTFDVATIARGAGHGQGPGAARLRGAASCPTRWVFCYPTRSIRWRSGATGSTVRYSGVQRPPSGANQPALAGRRCLAYCSCSTRSGPAHAPAYRLITLWRINAEGQMAPRCGALHQAASEEVFRNRFLAQLERGPPQR